MKNPCKECLTLSICRGRSYMELIDKCNILDSYIEDNATRRRPGSIRLIIASVLDDVEKTLRLGVYAP